MHRYVERLRTWDAYYNYIKLVDFRTRYVSYQQNRNLSWLHDDYDDRSLREYPENMQLFFYEGDTTWLYEGERVLYFHLLKLSLFAKQGKDMSCQKLFGDLTLKTRALLVTHDDVIV